LTLVRLDIESSGQHGAASSDPRANPDGSGSRQPGGAERDVESADGVTDSQLLNTAASAGSLVDVLA
jgi:hypothetical protein